MKNQSEVFSKLEKEQEEREEELVHEKTFPVNYVPQGTKPASDDTTIPLTVELCRKLVDSAMSYHSFSYRVARFLVEECERLKDDCDGLEAVNLKLVKQVDALEGLA